MSDVNVTTDIDVSFSNPGDPVVVLADSDIETIIVNEQGPPGLPGQPGPPGPRGDTGIPGNTVLYGNTDPSSNIGVDGNFYINTTSHFMFGPKAGVWPAGTSLIGPQGPQGIQGVQGPQGIQGAQGIQGIPGNTVLYGAGPPASGTGVNGNFYIDTTANFLYGPKAAGAWPAGTSLIGPQGPQGVQGNEGPVGPTGPVPEAPTDGQIYGRKNSAWTPTGIPPGSVMLFYQAAAPTGWTQVTTHNDKALRVVSGAGGGSGGSNPFSTVMAQTAVGNHTLTLAETAAGIVATGLNGISVLPTGGATLMEGFRGGSYTASTQIQAASSNSWIFSEGTASPVNMTNMTSNNTISVTSSNTGGGAHNHPITMAMQYVDVILASKN